MAKKRKKGWKKERRKKTKYKCGQKGVRNTEKNEQKS